MHTTLVRNTVLPVHMIGMLEIKGDLTQLIYK